jgi:hypothetical protein
MNLRQIETFATVMKCGTTSGRPRFWVSRSPPSVAVSRPSNGRSVFPCLPGSAIASSPHPKLACFMMKSTLRSEASTRSAPRLPEFATSVLERFVCRVGICDRPFRHTKGDRKLSRQAPANAHHTARRAVPRRARPRSLRPIRPRPCIGFDRYKRRCRAIVHRQRSALHALRGLRLGAQKQSARSCWASLASERRDAQAQPAAAHSSSAVRPI